MDEDHNANIKLAKLVRGRRASLDWTMEELAEKADISRNTVWAIENHKHNFGIEPVFAILKAMDIHLKAYTSDDSFSQNVL